MNFARGNPTDQGTHEICTEVRIRWKYYDGTQHCVVLEVEVLRSGQWGMERTWGYHYEPKTEAATAVLYGIRAGKPQYRDADYQSTILSWLLARGIA